MSALFSNIQNMHMYESGANIPARFAAGDKLYNLQFPRRAIDREEEREKETLKV